METREREREREGDEEKWAGQLPLLAKLSQSLQRHYQLPTEHREMSSAIELIQKGVTRQRVPTLCK